ncbi:MAG TPA: quinoprotein dehydrogenase-associated putative ABC transporter substrate-binding protein [Burkholderiales bacterium]|nr:quinoprotein dehydrogenase-associated putative ABC transporter substrate-binding protein [Burkholderiales bacterium]
MARLPNPKSNRCSNAAVLARIFSAWALAVSVCGTVAAQDEPFVKPRALKVCDDPNNLPFSNDKGEGFENKIAKMLARNLDLPLEVFHYPMRINFVRNTIRYKLPNQSEYRCDLLAGVPADFTAVATTQPYFRSTHVLVYARGRKIDAASVEQFLALDKSVLSGLKIGVYERTPAVDWMKKHDLLDQAVHYRLLNADPDHYPGKIIDDDLAKGRLDAVVVWGPIGGYFARRAASPELVVLPLKSEPGVRMDFGVSMGVRQGEKAWRSLIQQALDQSRADILQLLREYGVPMVDDKGEPIP